MRMRRPYQGEKQPFVCGLVAAGIFVLLLLSLSLLEKVTATTVQLQNDNGEAAGYSGTISSCRVFGSVLQASADQYPLRLLSVDFTLYRDFAGAASSAQVRAVVYSIGADGYPDIMLAHTQPVTITTFYPEWVSIPLTHTYLFMTDSDPFLVGVEYVDGAEGTVPSILMDSSTAIPTNRNFYSQDCGDSWVEHYDWWADPSNVGYNMIRATVETNATLIPGLTARGALPGTGKQYALARTADGRVHLIYADLSYQHIYHLWSDDDGENWHCLLYTSPSPRDLSTSRMPSSA